MLLVGEDLPAYLMTIGVLDYLKRKEYFRPIVVMVRDLPRAKVNLPALQEYAFLEKHALRDIVMPFCNVHRQEFNVKATGAVTPEQMALRYRSLGCNVLRANNINSSEFHSIVHGLDRLKAVISLRCTQILRESLLRLLNEKSAKVLNIHTSLLPEYRGVLTCGRRIYDIRRGVTGNDDSVGLTLHLIETAEIDAGNILNIGAVPYQGASVFGTLLGLVPTGVSMLTHQLDALSRGGLLVGVQQDLKQAHYYTYPTEVELKEMQDIGVVLATPDDLSRAVLGAFGNVTDGAGSSLLNHMQEGIRNHYFCAGQAVPEMADLSSEFVGVSGSRRHPCKKDRDPKTLIPPVMPGAARAEAAI